MIEKMKKESLEKLREAIIKAIDDIEEIDEVDKVEGMLNLSLMLDDYDETIKILRKERNNKWKK